MEPSTLQKRRRLDADGDEPGPAHRQPRKEDNLESLSAGGGSPGSQTGASSPRKTLPLYVDHGANARLAFGTESWAARKTTNEDRSALCISGLSPLGPAFAIFDGHGGIFTADFLVGKLLKTLATSVRQQLGGRELQQLEASVTLSRSEASRLKGIKQQTEFISEQLKQVAQLVDVSSLAGDGEQDDEARGLRGGLEDMLHDLATEAHRIEEEESERLKYRRRWVDDHDAGIQRGIVDAFKRIDEQALAKNPAQDGSTALMVWFYGGNAGEELEKANSARQEPRRNEFALDSDQSGHINYRPAGFYALNLGDSRAVLCRRDNTVIRLTSDHKPDRLDEKTRIEKAGGFVKTLGGTPRVFSAAGAGLAVKSELSTYLAVSRAFGDRSLKTPSPLVSCVPEISRFKLDPNDLFVLIACDGVWDVLSDEDAVSIVRRHLQDAKVAANAVIKAAYLKGSEDNLTATVITFREGCGVSSPHTAVSTSAGGQVDAANVESSGPDAQISTGRANDGANDTNNDALEVTGTGDDEEIDMFNL